VTEETLAKWAGLTELHDNLYSGLNREAHFDLLRAFQLHAVVRGTNEFDASLDEQFERGILAVNIDRICLMALCALRDLGEPEMGDFIERQKTGFHERDTEMSSMISTRSKNIVAESGWSKDTDTERTTIDHDTQIVHALDRLEADLPAIVERHMVDGVLDEAHFWPDFAGAADDIVEQACAESEYVHDRIDQMLKAANLDGTTDVGR
jgi:hypothetical protein